MSPCQKLSISFFYQNGVGIRTPSRSDTHALKILLTVLKDRCNWRELGITRISLLPPQGLVRWGRRSHDCCFLSLFKFLPKSSTKIQGVDFEIKRVGGREWSSTERRGWRFSQQMVQPVREPQKGQWLQLNDTFHCNHWTKVYLLHYLA